MQRLFLSIFSWIHQLLSKQQQPISSYAASLKARRGKLGEAAALAHLKAKGYRLVARNWRKGQSEIDLVMRDGDVLVFIEVRSRLATALVDGFHSITLRKKAALKRAQLAYIQGLRRAPIHFRWDIVAVEITQLPTGGDIISGIHLLRGCRIG